MIKLIGLVGLAGAGKDTVGALLSMVGYAPVSFAAPLRAEVADFLNKPDFSLIMPAQLKAKLTIAISLGLGPVDVFLKPTSALMRIILQQWGTEYRRAQDPNYWVKQMQEKLLGMEQDAVVTDVRFPNEVELIRNLGGRLWRISKANLQVMEHLSESTALDLATDVTIHNDKDIHELAAAVRSILVP